MTRRPGQKLRQRAIDAPLVDAGLDQVVLQHQPHEITEPASAAVQPRRSRGLGRVAAQLVDLGRSQVALIDAHVALPIEADQAEGDLAQLADGVRLAGGDDVVVGFVLLEHQPHRLDVFLGVPPVALGIEVAQVEVLLLALQDGGDARASPCASRTCRRGAATRG